MEKTKPIIGILGYVDENMYGVPLSYLQYAGYFGTPRIINIEEPVDKQLDLLILPGGSDINPVRYGGRPHYFNSDPDPVKEFFDVYILPEYVKAGVPIFGICRGLQTIAVHFGAVLVQHIVHERSTERSEAVHPIALVNDSSFKEQYELKYGKGKIKVNSMHHQCVSSKNLPSCLEILGVYPNKPEITIEVLRHRTLPIYGVQYHPEELVEDALGDFIIQDILLKKNTENINQDKKVNVENVLI